MAEQPENLVLEHLRHIRGTVDRIAGDVSELRTRVGRLERSLAEMHVTLAEHSVRMDKTDARYYGANATG